MQVLHPAAKMVCFIVDIFFLITSKTVFKRMLSASELKNDIPVAVCLVIIYNSPISTTCCRKNVEMGQSRMFLMMGTEMWSWVSMSPFQTDPADKRVCWLN